ncbi:MAG: ParA family protein [Acidimicrobiales bacterium]
MTQPHRKAGPTRLVVTAHKGGVGKTTLAVNLAAVFAQAGRRTLLVDVDPQGTASVSLGLFEVAKPSMYEVLMGTSPARDAIVATSIDGLDLLPADLDLAGAEIALPRQPMPAWQCRLHDVLAGVENAYDIVVLDCAPGLGVLAFAGLVAGDWALLAATPAYYSLRSIAHVLDTVTQAQTFNPALQVLGIVPSIVGTRTLVRDEVLEIIDQRWAQWALPGLPRRVAFEEAAVAGQPVTTYAPASSAASCAVTLAQEILARASA